MNTSAVSESRIRRTAYLAFGLSGICAISSGVIVSLLQDLHGFSYQMTGNLLTCMNLGNMAAAFLTGIFSGKIGMRKTALILAVGYAVGYALTGMTALPALLLTAFLLIGLTKGNVLNTCTVLAGTYTKDQKVSMQLLHACYATGALLCPFLLAGLGAWGDRMPMFGMAAVGMLVWLTFVTLPEKKTQADRSVSAGREKRDMSFLKTPVFWLLAALLFCQNGAEYGVTGWMVTYYKNQGILSGDLAAYTMTIMWGVTLAGRLLIAFAVPIRDHFRALAVMGGACTVLYAGLILIQTPVPAILVLILFSLAMAGTSPMITASLGSRTSSESMAVLLPLGSLGGLVMPLLIGTVSERMGLQAGMSVDLLPCACMFLLSLSAGKIAPVSPEKAT